MNQPHLLNIAGFRAIGVRCGLKQADKPDLALLLAAQPAAAAAVFTRSQVKAAPVLYDQALMSRTDGYLQGVVVNAGNANAVTGEQGLRDAEQMARLTEQICGLPFDSVFVMSTGIIGQPLPMDKVESGINLAHQAIQTADGQQWHNAAQAIMTTDLRPKTTLLETKINGAPIRIGGIAKGSGMIEPNMATMLSIIATDAPIEPPLLDVALRQAVECSFNAITVDGDTSTNDTVLAMASAQADSPPINQIDLVAYNQFVDGLTEVCTTLAKMVVRDGEGATKLIEITVEEAFSTLDAKIVAKTVANSPLVKTAFFGNDPNWGRIIMAIGRSPADTIDPHRISLRLGEVPLVHCGEPCPFDEAALSAWLAAQDTVNVTINLGVGNSQATVWTCDFSYDYVKINAEYHT